MIKEGRKGSGERKKGRQEVNDGRTDGRTKGTLMKEGRKDGKMEGRKDEWKQYTGRKIS